jgi:molybdopterin-binding protein
MLEVIMPIDREKMLSPRQAATALGISYPTVKQWIYHNKLRTVKTAGGHHRIPASELDKYLPKPPSKIEPRRNFRRISGRNQLVGTVVEVRLSGLMAQVKLSIAGQQITSIITADAVNELRLAKGQKVAALIKATEVMIIRV